jgi:putrescine transport system ATP-binding protein
VRKGNPVTIALRPEKMQLEWQEPVAPANAIDGLIGSVAYFGDGSHYLVKIADREQCLAVALQNSAQHRAAPDTRSRQVWLTWQSESAILLPRE